MKELLELPIDLKFNKKKKIKQKLKTLKPKANLYLCQK